MYQPIPPQPDCASAWHAAVQHLEGLPCQQASNVVIDIADPRARATLDDPAVAEVDAFLRSKEKKPVETVANTVFPASLYRRYAHRPSTTIQEECTA